MPNKNFRWIMTAVMVGFLTATGTGAQTLVPVVMSTNSDDLLAEQLAEFRRDYEIDYPDDNMPNQARTDLGHALFFDPRLSRSGGQSCASCHNPAFAWGDGLALGLGDNLAQLGRRSPSILNLAWAEPLMWDGRAESLEDQAMGPLKSEAEMNMSLEQLVAILEGIDGYAQMFAAAFDGDPTITPDRVSRAIAAYERTIVSGMAPFDDWVNGDASAVSDQAKRGFQLFVGKGNCAICHEGWRFTDDSFYDIGLDDTDIGRGAFFPNIVSMQYAFKTPGLRNINQRGPYMHDGSVASLSDVVQHYNTGGVDRPSRSNEVRVLDLSREEIGDIVAFLHTLTSDDAPVHLPVLPH